MRGHSTTTTDYGDEIGSAALGISYRANTPVRCLDSVAKLRPGDECWADYRKKKTCSAVLRSIHWRSSAERKSSLSRTRAIDAA